MGKLYGMWFIAHWSYFFKEEQEAELVELIVDLLYILVARKEFFFLKNQHSIFLFNRKMDKETEGLTQIPGTQILVTVYFFK